MTTAPAASTITGPAIQKAADFTKAGLTIGASGIQLQRQKRLVFALFKAERNY